VLRQVEAGARVAQICSKVGISERLTISGSGNIPRWE
jgi:hypothetical protein